MKNKKGTGFTIIELLVVFAIAVLLTAGLIFYSRTSERQLILFKDQAKIITALTKAKSLAINTFAETQAPCGYGVNFQLPDTIIIFKEEASQLDCSDKDNVYTPLNPNEKFEEIKLDTVAVRFRSLTNSNTGDFSNIVFIPPDPLIYIDGDRAIDYALIEIETVDGSALSIIKVTNMGQITIQ